MRTDVVIEVRELGNLSVAEVLAAGPSDEDATAGGDDERGDRVPAARRPVIQR